MSNIFHFYSATEMDKCISAQPGDYGIIDGETFIYTNDDFKWEPFIPKGEDISLTQNAYNMAKMFAANATPLSDEQIEDAQTKIHDLVYDNPTSQYFMLLFKDLSYYTVFAQDNDSYEHMDREVIYCMQDLGDIISIDWDEAGTALECWIKTFDGEAHVGYLFNYDIGVIRCQF